MGRINLEPPQATASKHWSPHNIPIKVWVGVRVECGHNHVFVVFPTAAVDNNVYTYRYSKTAVIHVLLNLGNFS